MNKFHIFFGIAFFCLTTFLHAEPDSLDNVRREIIFRKTGAGNYLLREDPEESSCLRFVNGDSRNVLIQPGNPTIRSYKHTTDACAFEPQQISWIVTTMRKVDHIEIQCRISVMINNRQFSQVKIESYGQDDHHLCASTILIKSATCVIRLADNPNRYDLDCLNKFVNGRFREIEVTLDGPGFDISETQLSNPFDNREKRYQPCRFKFCRIISTEEEAKMR